MTEQTSYGWYRTPMEIRDDMDRISGQIREINDRMNIRDMVVESLYDAGTDPEKQIRRLEQMIEKADRALSDMRQLEEKLTLLQEELEESRCLSCRY